MRKRDEIFTQALPLHTSEDDLLFRGVERRIDRSYYFLKKFDIFIFMLVFLD